MIIRTRQIKPPKNWFLTMRQYVKFNVSYLKLKGFQGLAMIFNVFLNLLKKVLIPGACSLVLSISAAPQPVDEALPMVGTAGHGHTYPGATVPFGFV
jgi:hypothetical protein